MEGNFEHKIQSLNLLKICFALLLELDYYDIGATGDILHLPHHTNQTSSATSIATVSLFITCNITFLQKKNAKKDPFYKNTLVAVITIISVESHA